MKTFTVIRAENRANGREDVVGTISADTQEQAEMEAAGQFECDELHQLIVTADEATTQQISISISMDQVWEGSGRLVDGRIVDCGAQFCDDTDESEAVYELIEDAITEGKDEIKIEIEGRDHIVSWSLT